MAIYMCSGKTGSGKTANAVFIVFKMWRKGKDVWSNTPLFFTDFNNGFGGQNILDHPQYFTIFEKLILNIASIFRSNAKKKKKGIKRRGSISYFDTIDETFHIKNAVILFDEGQTLFRNYDWESIPRLFLYKIEQNRKHSLDLVTTAQRVKAVNINYRELIQYWTHFEKILSLKIIHWYRKKKKDCDWITENMQEQDIPNLKPPRWGLLGKWQKKLYDTMYDIGFEPIQHYKVMIGSNSVRLHLESGMTVKQAITYINSYNRLLDLV